MRRLNAWRRRHGLVILAVCAVSSLLLSSIAVVGIVRVAQQRENDRVTADLKSCERGNEFRQQVRDLGSAAGDLIEGTLLTSVAGPSASPEDRANVRAFLDLLHEPGQPFDVFTKTVSAITTTNCTAAVPGATPGAQP